MRHLQESQQLLHAVAQDLPRVGHVVSLPTNAACELLERLGDRRLGDHRVVATGGLEVVPRDIPDMMTAAINDRSPLSHVIREAIHWMAVELKAVGEDRDWLDLFVVTAEQKIGLRRNGDALGGAQLRLELELPEPIPTRNRESEALRAADDRLLPRPMSVRNEGAQTIDELFLEH